MECHCDYGVSSSGRPYRPNAEGRRGRQARERQATRIPWEEVLPKALQEGPPRHQADHKHGAWDFRGQGAK